MNIYVETLSNLLKVHSLKGRVIDIRCACDTICNFYLRVRRLTLLHPQSTATDCYLRIQRGKEAIYWSGCEPFVQINRCTR